MMIFQDNGGAPLRHYQVEKKGKDGSWVSVSNVYPDTVCPVDQLNPGEEYEFRVMAVNVKGVGSPLVTTKPIIAKYPFGQYLCLCCISVTSFLMVYC